MGKKYSYRITLDYEMSKALSQKAKKRNVLQTDLLEQIVKAWLKGNLRIY